MERKKQKIEFYKERDLGGKLNVTFDFIRQNWKVMLKYITYIFLPLILISSLGFSKLLMTESRDLTTFSSLDWIEVGISYLILIFSSLLLPGLTVAFHQLYNSRDNGLDGIVFNDLKPYFFQNIRKTFVLGSIFILALVFSAGLAVGLAASFGLWMIFFVISVLIFLLPTVMILPTYLFEDINVWQAISRGYRFGWNTFGEIFLMEIVFGIISSFLSGIMAIPYYVLIICRKFFVALDGPSNFFNSYGFTFLMFASICLLYFSSILVNTFVLMGFNFHYGHVVEKMDAVSVEEGIENFEKKADENEDESDSLDEKDNFDGFEKL
jgi:hypothetical protein